MTHVTRFTHICSVFMYYLCLKSSFFDCCCRWSICVDKFSSLFPVESDDCINRPSTRDSSYHVCGLTETRHIKLVATCTILIGKVQVEPSLLLQLITGFCHAENKKFIENSVILHSVVESYYLTAVRICLQWRQPGLKLLRCWGSV